MKSSEENEDDNPQGGNRAEPTRRLPEKSPATLILVSMLLS
jgi:hypothetical protein